MLHSPTRLCARKGCWSGGGGVQPRARAQGRQTKPGTKNNVPVQLPYKSTSTVSDSAQRDIPPLPFSGHASSPWRSASPSPHANRISAFPFLRNPIILWRWWTLPSQLEANPTLISQPKLKKPTGLRVFGKQQRETGRKDPGIDSRTFNSVRVTVLLHFFSLECFHHRLHPVSQKLPWRLNLPMKTVS